MTAHNVVSLDRAGQGDYVVVSLDGGIGFMKKIHHMGIYPGSHIKLVTPPAAGGPVRVVVKGSHLGIGRGMASRIYVKSSR